MTPSSAFNDLGLSPDILTAVDAAGFKSPTAIQAEGIPAFLEGRDVVFQAQTGTGKTAAFVLPIVESLQPNPGTVEALVLTPTRELAKQVCVEFGSFGRDRGIQATPIYGGTSFEKQYEALETAQVVVATPGRLLDLLRRKKFDPSGIRFFGLDEADELLSMGFEKDVLDVIAQIPKVRQSFICSATINPAVHRVAQNFIVDPIEVNVSSDEIGARSVRHEYFKVRPAEKLDALRRLVQSEARTGAIIFANTRAATFMVTAALQREDISVDVLNGDLSQAEREKALSRMKQDHVQFLVATDVAARGIDISGLPAVINYDMPESPDVYIHRTGRTGRAGQAGVAYSLVMPSDITVFHALEKFYHLELHNRALMTRDELRAAVADHAIDDVLAGLDGAGRLSYAQHIPLARRLADREDGPRLIAKLIAHFSGTRGDEIVVAPDKAAKPEKTAKPEKAAEPDQAAETAQPEEAAPAPRPKRGKRNGATKAAALPATTDEVAVAEEVVEEAAPAAEAAPEKPAKPRRERSRRKESVSTEEVAAKSGDAETSDDSEEVETTPSGDAPTVEAVAEALAKASRRRGRWRGARRLAEDLDCTEEVVVSVLESDEQFEQSRKNPTQWRLLKDASSEDAVEEKPAKREKKAARRDDDGPAEKFKASRSRSRGKKDAPAPAPAPAPAKARDDEYVTIRINIGTEHGIDATALAEELVTLAGLDLEDVGAIDMSDDSSTVPVLEDYWEDMAAAVENQEIAGQVVEVKRPRRRGRRR